MKLHARTPIFEQARHELAEFLLALKYQIRAERHPDDPDKRGDEA